MSYEHLSLEERHYIEVELRNGSSMNEIAKSLNRSQSTISREVKRNKGKRGYRHKQANGFAQERHTNKKKSIKVTDSIKEQIIQHLEEGWSPEQIAGRLKKEGVVSLHHETIYKLILRDKEAGGKLYTHLRHQNKRYRKRYGNAHNRTGIPNRVDIDERPEEANNRERLGDWEGDTMIGKQHKGALVTLDERQTKLRLALPVRRKTSNEVAQAIISLLEPIKEFVSSLTFDNGKEFSLHTAIAQALDCDTYFAKPYHSWERGQNENANGLLRQYFPKSMELIDVTVQQVFDAVHKLNSRPRKCLGFRTPYEAFLESTGVDMRKLMDYALIS